MCVILYNNYVSETYKTFGVNAYCTPKGSTAFLKNNPWVRALYPAKASYNTRIVKLNSGVKAIAEYNKRIAVTKETQFIDFREAAIVRNANELKNKLFRGN